MTDLIQAVQQTQVLVNLLCRVHRDGGHYIAEHGLQKAIEDADIKIVKLNAMSDEQQQAEPVAIALHTGTRQGITWLCHVDPNTPLYTAPPQQQAEPVGTAKDLFTNAALERLDIRPSTKVYLDAQPQRKPLTDKEIVDAIQHLYQNRAVAEMAVKVGMEDYRAIEAAHGIKGEA